MGVRAAFDAQPPYLPLKGKPLTGFLETLLSALLLYGVLGVAFALPFVWRGASRIDPAAARGTLPFRILIVPGVVALWPILLRRWWRASSEDA